jgi:hypothetical protein
LCSFRFQESGAVTHFQVPDDRVLQSSAAEKLPTPWPGTPDGYRLFVNGNSGDERIGIQLGQKIELQINGGKDCYLVTTEWRNVRAMISVIGSAGAVAWGNANPGPIALSEIVATRDPQKFTVDARGAGATTLFAIEPGTYAVKASLDVVVGNFEKHPGMQVDLIANVCRGSDSLKIHALQRMLNNNKLLSIDADGFGVYNNGDNIFNQGALQNKSPDAKIGRMTCGIVARWRTEQVFPKSVAPLFDWYLQGVVHEPLAGKPTDRKQIKYRSDRIETLRNQIVRALNDGSAVRAAVVDVPTIITPTHGYLVTYATGGHTVVIVGCTTDGKQFLYIDPWGGGSQMEYQGGIAGAKFKDPCLQIGKFIVDYDPDRRVSAADTKPNMIREHVDTQGSFTYSSGNFLEIVAAPFLVPGRR